jgi:hypothetical protein
VWLKKIGLIQKKTQTKMFNWYMIKDFFALIKNIAGLAISVLKLIRRKHKLKDISKGFDSNLGLIVTKENAMFDLLKQYSYVRNK